MIVLDTESFVELIYGIDDDFLTDDLSAESLAHFSLHSLITMTSLTHRFY